MLQTIISAVDIDVDHFIPKRASPLCTRSNIQQTCTTIHIGLFHISLSRDIDQNLSDGRITIPVCDLVMIRCWGLGQLGWSLSTTKLWSCCCGTTGCSSVCSTGLGTTLRCHLLRRTAPPSVSTRYERGVAAFPTTIPGIGYVLSVVIHMSVPSGI